MNNLNQNARDTSDFFEPGPSIGINEEDNITIMDDKFFFFKKKGNFVKVDTNNILYLKAENSYTYIITEDAKYMSTSNLTQMEELFATPNFMRVHRSYIINLDNLTSIDLVNNKIFLGEHIVPFSRSMKKTLIKIFHLIK